MSAHSLCSPSGADRWMACPASVLETKRMQDLDLSDESPEATEGTLAHEKCASAMQMYVDGHTYKLPDNEMAPHIRTYVDSITADLDLGGQILGIECRLDCPLDSRVGGTPDCVHRCFDTLVVTDLKYGQGIYVPADSMQLKIYGWLAYLEYGESWVKTIELRVVQPRFEGTAPVRSTFWSAGEFAESMAKEVRDALSRIDSNPNERVPGDHCQFCPAARVPELGPCPARVDAMRAVLAKTPLQQEETTALGPLVDLQFILDHRALLAALVKEAEAAAIIYLESGGTLEGYSLADAYGNRKWLRGEEIVASELTERGLLDSQVWIPKIISPAQAEKAGLKGEIDDLIVRELKGKKLVENKKRAAAHKAEAKALLAKMKKDA